MSKSFQFEYKKEIGYDQKIELIVRLEKTPMKEVYQDLLDIVEKLGEVAEVYLPVPKPVETPKK